MLFMIYQVFPFILVYSCIAWRRKRL